MCVKPDWGLKNLADPPPELKPIFHTRDAKSAVLALAYSEDGKYLAVSYDNLKG